MKTVDPVARAGNKQDMKLLFGVKTVKRQSQENEKL